MNSQSNCTGEISPVSAMILGIFNGASGLGAIVGNVTVLATLYKNEAFRLPSYYFLASLAVADFLVGLVVNPLYIALINFVSWQYRETYLLQMESFLAMSSSMIIMHNLSIMSVDRYIAVIHPLRYNLLVTPKRSGLLIATIWIFGLALNSVYFALGNDHLPKLWIVGGVLTGLFPMVLVLFCNSRILRAAHVQSRRIDAENSVSVSTAFSSKEGTVGTHARWESRRNRKAVWTVIVLVSVVVVLSVPVIVVSTMQIVTNDLCRRRQNNRAWMWAVTLSLTSSAMDPWIYAMRIQEFKVAFKRTLCIK